MIYTMYMSMYMFICICIIMCTYLDEQDDLDSQLFKLSGDSLADMRRVDHMSHVNINAHSANTSFNEVQDSADKVLRFTQVCYSVYVGVLCFSHVCCIVLQCIHTGTSLHPPTQSLSTTHACTDTCTHTYIHTHTEEMQKYTHAHKSKTLLARTCCKLAHTLSLPPPPHTRIHTGVRRCKLACTLSVSPSRTHTYTYTGVRLCSRGRAGADVFDGIRSKGARQPCAPGADGEQRARLLAYC